MAVLKKFERRVEYSAAGVAYISPEGELYCNANNVMLAIESAIRERGPVFVNGDEFAARVCVTVELLGDLESDGDAGA